MKTNHTTKELREMWRDAKQIESDARLKHAMETLKKNGHAVSEVNMRLVMMAAIQHGVEGLPYIDFKTEKGWKEAGFALLPTAKEPMAITITWKPFWVENKRKKEEYGVIDHHQQFYPKATYLYHSSQVVYQHERVTLVHAEYSNLYSEE